MGARMILTAAVAIAAAALPAAANAQATVEVHWDTLAGSAFTRAGDYTSDLSPADAANGVWQLLPGAGGGAPGLGFVKLRNTASGTVEVHWDGLSGGAYRRAGDYASDFSPADAANGSFQLFGSANGAPELGFVKLRNTGSGTVEVHWDVLSNGAYHRAGDYASDFSTGDAANGVWQLLPGAGGGAPELGFVKVFNTPGTVEVHWDALSNGAYHRAGDYPSDFSPADNPDGVWQLLPGAGGGAPELGLVKLRNTGSGTIEAHWATLSDGAYHRAGDYPSDFSPADAANGTWQLVPTSGAPELGFVKTGPPPTPAPPAASPPPPPQALPAPPAVAAPVTTVVPRPRGRRHVRVRIALSWTWNGKHTRLTRVRLGRLPRHGRITVVCRGRGCARPRARAARRRGVRSLLSTLAGSRYRAGDRLLITVAVPGRIAERAEVTIRNGALPVVRLL